MVVHHSREHLDHLPGRSFLLGPAVISALVTIGAVTQLAVGGQGATVLWIIALALGVLSLLALGIAWEERRAHIHALVREALEDGGREGAADPIAELLRMGAHREADYLRSLSNSPAQGGP